jgi:hypothetical protein
MTRSALHRTGFAGLGLVAVALVMTLIPQGAASAVLEACINPGNGNMRLVDANTACHANEIRVSWNVVGPQGPTGPQGATGPTGPQGPAGDSGGPPFVWVCTPANYDFGNNGQADIDIFNGSATTANVAAHFLAKDGTNLAGQTIPVTNPPAVYPGQTGSATVALPSLNTLIIPYQTGGGVRANSNALLATVRVISDQPIVVGSTLFNGPPQAVPCNQLPK